MPARATSRASPPPAPVRAAWNFTDRMRLVCSDMIGRLPELAHIDLPRVAVTFSQARQRAMHGTYASLTPLRFQGGALVGRRGSRSYAVERVFDCNGREMLYLLSFRLPRFLDLDLREKLITVLHELWHVSPAFDGDIRRHSGRYHAHTHSQGDYDEQMGHLADRWLAQSPPLDLWSFLQCSFDGLLRQHGRIVGLKIRRPRLLPVE